MFANGITLDFTDADVPAPPAVSFADNLALLNQMWDDTAPHWQGHSELTICGVPVPVKYWKDVYSRSKSNPGQWKGVKSNWSLWKVQPLLSFCCNLSLIVPYFKMIIVRWRQGSEADFWKDFTDNDGNRMTYTAIVKKLTANRLRSDAEMAKQAKEEFGSRFDEIFVYRKNGVNHVKTKAADIAKQYRVIKGHMDVDE